MTPGGRLARGVARWVGWVSRHPVWVVLAVVVATTAAGRFAAGRLSISTDTAQMLSPHLPFLRAYEQYKRAFPQYVDTIVLVIEGDGPEAARRATERITSRLEGEPHLFTSVYAPGSSPYFERSALLYLEPDELDALADRLAEVQPFLGRLTRDRSLGGLSAMVVAALDAEREGEAIDLAPLLGRLADGVEAVRDHRPYRLSWEALMGGGGGTGRGRRRFVIVQPRLDFHALLPAADAMAHLHRLRRDLHLGGGGPARMWITGGVALSHEELLSVQRGAVRAGLLSLGMVAVVLFVGLGSVRLVVATLITLVVGLILTGGFAAVAVGHLNMISVAFAILYIGLGVDYAIHLGLRYREVLREGGGAGGAMARAAGDVGGALMVCTATTSIGLFSFVPTAYRGVSELGIIAGGGMVIALVTTLTLLPALVALRPLTPRRAARKPLSLGRLTGGLPRVGVCHRRPVLWTTAVVTVASVALLPFVRFDDNPLHLMESGCESVATFERLLADPELTPWFIAVLAEGGEQAAATAARLEHLDTVARATTLDDLVPTDQGDKLDTIEEIALLLGPELGGDRVVVAPPATTVEVAALRRLHRALDGQKGGVGSAAEGRRLAAAIDTLLARWSEAPRGAAGDVAALEEGLLGGLDDALTHLRTALSARPVTRADLPPALVARWVAGDLRLVQVAPREDVRESTSLRRFVRQVQAAAPAATGPPVLYLEGGRAVVSAFRHAFAYALAAITLLLLLLLRPRRDAFLVLTPLLLAGVVTGAATVVLRIPFNFANIIALPLLLGIGVDSGLHMVHRARSGLAARGGPLETSTARGVFYSALTTVCSFGTLAFSPHRGTASMGLLLAVGVALTVAATLLVLPALLGKAAGDTAPEAA